jgi:hypothetical protein
MVVTQRWQPMRLSRELKGGHPRAQGIYAWGVRMDGFKYGSSTTKNEEKAKNGNGNARRTGQRGQGFMGLF